MRWFPALLVAFAISCGFLRMAPALAIEDHIVQIPANDPGMTAAIEKARNTLPMFWGKLAKPGPGETGFALKVPMEEKGKREFFWLTNIERNGDVISGTIDNEPESVTAVKLGQRIQFSADRIADWLFMRNGKMVGNETLRPLLKQMPKDEAERLRRLYETP